MAKQASLAELMGSHAAGSGEGLTLHNLPSVLGNAMPDLPRTPIGRHRLLTALQQRFGANFRTLPGVTGLIKQFDDSIALEVKIAHLKSIKPKYAKKD